MLPCIASVIWASFGRGVFASSAVAAITWPDWQYPHWGTWILSHAACTALATRPSIPSIVVTFFPATAEIGVTHESVGTPSTWTMHEPQRAAPQPNLVPVMPR